MDPKVKQKALRMISNGIYILTSRTGDKIGAALVTWLSQVSFRPPLIVAAIRPESNVFDCLSESGDVAVHILGADQQEIARKFISTTQIGSGTINSEPYKDGKTSAPILSNAPAYIECKVRKIIDGGGDHKLVILEVLEAELIDPVRPLLVADSPWNYGG